MTDSSFTPVVQIPSDSLHKIEALIEEYVTKEGNFVSPAYITVHIETNNNDVTSMKTQWKWDYEAAKRNLSQITIGRAIGLYIQLSKLTKRIGVKLSPNNPSDILDTFQYLLMHIPKLSDLIIVTHQSTSPLPSSKVQNNLKD